MKGLPPSIRVPKEENTLMALPSLDNNPPPIITHTCATPMATPQVPINIYKYQEAKNFTLVAHQSHLA